MGPDVIPETDLKNQMFVFIVNVLRLPSFVFMLRYHRSRVDLSISTDVINLPAVLLLAPILDSSDGVYAMRRWIRPGLTGRHLSTDANANGAKLGAVGHVSIWSEKSNFI